MRPRLSWQSAPALWTARLRNTSASRSVRSDLVIPPLAALAFVALALVAAMLADWTLVPRQYPAAAVYCVPLLLAAWLLNAPAVAGLTILVTLLSIASSNLQHQPLGAWLIDDAGLVTVGILASMVAFRRQQAETGWHRAAAGERGVVAELVEREQARRQLALQYQVSEILAEAATLAEAGAPVLKAVCEYLDWSCGALWYHDSATDTLSCTEVWGRADEPVAAFLNAGRTMHMAHGEGLPGRVWASGTPVWITDVSTDLNYSRAEFALQVNLHAAFGFPINVGGEIVGVLEFLSRASLPPDHNLMDFMTSIGTQVGRFVEHKHAEQQIVELLARERAANSQAQAALQQRDEFLAVASHDLKGPLTAILGYAELGRRQLAKTVTNPPPRLISTLSSIEQQARRMTTQVNGFLDAKLLQEGRALPLHLEPANLVELARRAASDWRLASDEHEFRVEAGAAPIVGRWDGPRIQRVLDNLLGNAVKYSPEGSTITLRVSRESTPQGAWAVLQVQDQGMGIPEADLPRIFDLYHRAENVRGRIGGTGLGLAGVRQTVEQHGGHVSVESIEGTGSTFTIRLPLPTSEAN